MKSLRLFSKVFQNMTETLRVSDWPSVKTNVPQLWIEQLNQIKKTWGLPSMAELLRSIIRDFLQEKFAKKRIFVSVDVYKKIEEKAIEQGMAVDQYVDNLILQKTRAPPLLK